MSFSSKRSIPIDEYLAWFVDEYLVWFMYQTAATGEKGIDSNDPEERLRYAYRYSYAHAVRQSVCTFVPRNDDEAAMAELGRIDGEGDRYLFVELGL